MTEAEEKLAQIRLTEEEQEILGLLGMAWNKLLALSYIRTNERVKFADGINSAQEVIALQVARRANLSVWI